MKISRSLALVLMGVLVLAGCQSGVDGDGKMSDDGSGKEMMEGKMDGEKMEDGKMDGEMMGMEIMPVSHATAVLEWDGVTIYSDPVGGAEAFEGKKKPDLVFVTDIHGDHLNVETLAAVLTDESVLIVPQAVADKIGEESDKELPGEMVILANGETTEQKGFSFEAVAMYNLPESDDSRHTKGRGNGYVIEKDGKRVYFSGDTADIKEMRELENIDVAFVCMNLPYTMDVDAAADAVLEFKPKKVYPYHYRGQDGLSDVAKFKELFNKGDADIEVVQLDWYPEK